MEFQIYSQQEALSQAGLTDYLLDTLVENLSYLFGEDMGTPENREEWIAYNLKDEHPHWRVVVGGKDGRYLGFLIYTVEDRRLTVCDIEINQSGRRNPILLLGLFQKAFQEENRSFDTIAGYINKGNQVSQDNFLKYATSVEERPRGYSFLIDEKAAEKLKSRVLKWRSPH